jgi:hypothetical protein
MPEYTTPNYIKTQFVSRSSKPQDRKLKGFGLQGLWIPLAMAANVQGDAEIARDAIGAPLRLSKAKDGTIKFAQNGRPVFSVAKDLKDFAGLVMDNWLAGQMAYISGVMKANPDGFKAEAQACREAGLPITQKADTEIAEAILRRQAAEAAVAEAANTIVPNHTKREAVLAS